MIDEVESYPETYNDKLEASNWNLTSFQMVNFRTFQAADLDEL